MRAHFQAILVLTAFILIAPVAGAEGGDAVQWDRYAEEGTVEVVTTNEDGSARVTKVWLAVVDGQGYIRTGKTRWGGNVERNPEIIASNRRDRATAAGRVRHRSDRARRGKGRAPGEARVLGLDPQSDPREATPRSCAWSRARRSRTKAAGSPMTALRKALYASASLGIGSLDYIIAVFLLKYYTNYTGLDAMWAGVALLVGKAFDAVSDPVMGYVSDRTRSRWGRRRPWFLLGSLPLAISMIGMFSARPEWSQTQLFAWLLITNILYWVGCTMVEVPHAAYGSEMTSTHRERISLMGWRQGFATLGLLLGGVLMFTMLEHAVDVATAEATARGLRGEAVAEIARIARGEAHGRISNWLAVYIVAVTVISFFGTRERSGVHPPPRDTLFGDFADALRNRPFLVYTAAFIVGQIADGLTATLALYTIEEWWGLGDPHPKFILLGYMAMAALSIPVWMRVAVHFEKGRMLAVGTFMGAIGLFAMLFVPQIGLWWAYASFYFAGVGLGVRTVMAMAIVPDIIDDDEVRTHTRKDGAYFGMLSLLRKLARSLAIGLSGIGLAFFGYVSGAVQQDADAQRGILIMFCAIPIVFSTGAAILFLRFPITRARHEETLAELERRRERRERERPL